VYAYRIRLKSSVVSVGLKGGVSIYSAEYNNLDLVDENDEMLSNNIKNAVLPNVGVGAYWSSRRFYVGLSVPDLLENYFDKDQANFPSGKQARQTRSSFISGGYSFPVSEQISLLPQVIGRYSADSKYNLPFNADFNLTAIIYQRIMVGATYRTDQSIEGIVHLQVAKKFNIGYSYDYSMSDIGRYAQGSHEITIGFDFIHDLNEYADPRFLKDF
jgi:type IX secretion system PorP/SprF family membrane protein